MKRLALFVIARSTPRADREWVLGDTLARLDEIAQSNGDRAARRWLRREAFRVLLKRGQPPFYNSRKKVAVPFSLTCRSR
jgi:hypothetical protein